MMKQRYPFDTSSFERIITDGYTYVDKTAYIHEMVSEGQFFFLARPRRFGKSLFISTLEQYFLGNKDLFKGLAIYDLQPGEWESYPVLHLDFTGSYFKDVNSITEFLEVVVDNWYNHYGIEIQNKSYSDKFFELIKLLSEKFSKKLVVLIDEYDYPLTKSIENKSLQEAYRSQLQSFYSILKKCDRYIKFCMLTGVSRYGKVSIFSGLNNLKDITFSDKYAGICGITEAELHSYYHYGVSRLAEKENISIDEAFSQLKESYDGYHFSKSMLDVYNPFSINNALSDLEIKDYWCQSGTPELLSKSLFNIDYDLESIIGMEVTETTLSNLSIYTSNPLPLFYQTGYLTLKSYNKEDRLYTVGYPNKEVENGLLQNILEVYAPTPKDSMTIASQMRKSLKDGDPEQFVTIMTSYLAGIPSRLKARVAKFENYYHTVFYCIGTLLGLDVQVEQNTAEGFIDMVITTPDYIYLIEFKVNGTAETAIRQIEQRHYTSKFLTDSRKLYEIGIAFSKQTGTISSHIIKALSQ